MLLSFVVLLLCPRLACVEHFPPMLYLPNHVTTLYNQCKEQTSICHHRNPWMTYCRELPLISTFSLTRKLAQSFYYIFTRWRYSHLRTNSLRQTIFYETIFCPLWCIWSGWRRHRHLLPHISLLLLSSSTLFGIFIIGTAPNSNSTQWQRNEGRLSDGVGFSLFWIDRLCNSFHFFAFGTVYLFALGHWTSQVSLHFFPLLCTAQLFTILCTFSNSLHFALWCSLLCTYRPFHAHTTFLTTLLLPSILWRLHQSCLFSPFSLLQRVYKKNV